MSCEARSRIFRICYALIQIEIIVIDINAIALIALVLVGGWRLRLGLRCLILEHGNIPRRLRIIMLRQSRHRTVLIGLLQ